MDFTTTKASETGPDRRQQRSSSGGGVSCSESPPGADVVAPSAPVDRQQPSGSHPCPACAQVLTSSRDLTNHLRGHNSPRSTTTDCSGGEDVVADYVCGVCQKALSSASSLDRHVLVHSGERPFKCRHCSMAFTTNGNMNRHLRTAHSRAPSPAHSCTDSEDAGSSSSDSERPLKRRLLQEEHNNNEIAKRNSPEMVSGAAAAAAGGKRKCPDYADEADSQRRHKILLGNARSEIKGSYTETAQSVFSCEACGRQDFATGALLEAHLERSHPEVPAKCDGCQLSFKNHRALSLHRFMVHFGDRPRGVRGGGGSVVGFNDLTFVDFSADKFPAIARAVCERSLHRPASGETPDYQCAKCLRAFPCRSALDAHETDCGLLGSARPPPRDRQQDDFFAGLDLQNKAALAEAKEGKDLADIQSIISLTSGPILQSFSGRHGATTPDNCRTKQSFGSSGSSGTPPSSEYHEEEAQDAFAAEFRKMKLKGEFPCRLCAAVYPNLRALKGHNRAHMGVGPGVPYPCNMCPYSSTDKATLVRHLRSHNGDRPYECSLCNYAFTTKANCERHVRNRHGKLSRDEVKSALIYHPSEDSTNDGSLERGTGSPRAGASLMRDEVRKTLLYQDRDEAYPAEVGIKDESKPRQPRDTFSRPLELTYRSDDRTKPNASLDDDLDSTRSSSGDDVSLVSESKADPRPIHRGSPVDLKKTTSSKDAASVDLDEDNVEAGEDAPLDLSMDVLDLSKKAAAAAAAAKKDAANINGNAEDLSGGNRKDFYNTTNQLLLTQALLKAGQVGTPSPSLEAFYANAHMLYRNFSGLPGAGILQPYLFNPLFGQDFSVKDRLQKDLVRGLQTSGGSLVEPPTSAGGYGSAAFPQNRNPPVASERTDYAASLMSAKMTSKAAPREKLDNSQSSNSVKMVIKNGVLMPKQKQRRYRTERPFTCEFCTARFTLRSNMERHVKQQHPQHWSQRPRGGHSTRGRPPANPPTLLQNLGQTSQPLPQSYPTLLPKLSQSLSADYGKHAISDQVKYAILAQQLKGNNNNNNNVNNKHPEENSDEELIIDEEKEAAAATAAAAREPSERTLSLLRGKLEASIESKASERVETNDAKSEVGNAIKEQEESDGESKIPDEYQDYSELAKKEATKDEKMDDDPKERNENEDLASVSEILDNASQHYQHFRHQYMSDEEGLVASTSDCNQSGSDEKSDSFNSANSGHSSTSKKKKKMKKKKKKKKSAYSMAPNRVICPYCERPFPWTSSLRRHILTHTGQKPYQCTHCSLLFTTKSNCDRHLLRKHKNSISKLRRTRSTSSPEMMPEQQQQQLNNNGSSSSNNNSQFAMRNVPERPYKCNQCPSSTFSTLGNLKKHRSAKHGVHEDNKSRPESPCSEHQNSLQQEEEEEEEECPEDDCQQQEDDDEAMIEPVVEIQEPAAEEPGEDVETTQDLAQQQQENLTKQNNDQSGYESQSSGVSDNLDAAKLPNNGSASANDASRSRKNSPTSSPGPNAEAPFKCHLCDSGFAERNDCLDHIKDSHESHYEILVAKGALDMELDPQDDLPPPPPSDGEERRGRFPDYSNRKVMCAFCMRRFWSAEDLRRHMRTHTGERPFSCDICCRRFTLKHSMLRHRKKHESVDSSMYVGTSGDEDAQPGPQQQQPPTITPRSQQQLQQQQSSSSSSRYQERASLPQVASVATADAAPSGLMRFNNPYDKLTTLTGKLSAGLSSSLAVDANDNTDNDLISNLLGIRDKSIIDRVLQASADDAAKLLGVKGNHE